MSRSIADLILLLKPFGDAAEQAGYEVEIKARAIGKEVDQITYRTVGYAERDLRDDPLCPDEEDG